MTPSDDIVPELAEKAMQEGLAKYPRFSVFGARLVERKLFQGSTYMLQYDQQPPKDDPDAWEFQNAVVKAYKRLAAGS